MEASASPAPTPYDAAEDMSRSSVRLLADRIRSIRRALKRPRCEPSAPTPTPTPTKTTQSRLLALPAELRNHIYELVLVPQGPVFIDRTNFKPPPLLSANRQIRTEASPIYYRDNTFKVDCSNFDSKVLQAFYPRWMRFCKSVTFNSQPKGRIALGRLLPSSSWTNLVEWLKAYHSQSLPGLEAPEGSCRITFAAAKMFSIVKKLAKLDCSEVLEILMDVKAVSEKQGIRWT